MRWRLGWRKSSRRSSASAPMLDKLDVRQIIRDHVQTLRSHATGEISFGDVSVFILLPVAAGCALALFRPVLTVHVAGALVTSLSIFAALLFNLLLLINDLAARNGQAGPQGSLRRNLLLDLHSNVSFCILIALVTLTALLLDYLHLVGLFWYRFALASVVYSITGMFLVTLLMVLKRIRVILRSEVEKKP